MNNKLDNYFNGKLRNHEVTPSPRAWEKVESKLSKKNNTAVAMRIAAGVALIAAASIVIVSQVTDKRKEVAKSQPTRPEIQQPAAETHSMPASASQSNPDRSTTAVAKRTRTSDRKNKPAPSEIKSERDATIAQQNVVMETSVNEVIAVIEPQPTTTTSKPRRMVIVYNLPTIKKSTAPADAVAMDEKKTGLQKVMDVAMDVRATENPLGGLREVKDELFARELRKDKNKTN